jgi:hypothetical protein
MKMTKRCSTLLGALGAALTSTGCAVVLDPVLPDGATHAVAILAQDLGPPPPSSALGSLSPDLEDLPTDTLVLMWSNAPELCSSPQIGGDCADAVVWQETVVLPPDLVRVGPVDLSDPRISSYSVAVVNDQCAGGSGGVDPPGGTMEILGTSATSITVDMVDALGSSAGNFTEADGTVLDTSYTVKGNYTIPRCEPGP